MQMNKKHLKRIIIVLLLLFIVGIATLFVINAYVNGVGKAQILTSDEAVTLSDVDCILVLGCKVREDGAPSDMLEDRLTRGIELYNLGAAPKLLMSGDHGSEDYDEVSTMKQFAIDAGIPSEDVFMDHAGFSTYESVYRAKEIFEADKIIIVTQEYHLYRAIYIAEKLGLEAYGVASDYHTYLGQTTRECREILARCKDFVTTIIKHKPTYLGDVIPIIGNGDATND